MLFNYKRSFSRGLWPPKTDCHLIEVMVAIGIASLLGLIMMQVIFPSFRIVQEGQIRTELQQQGELALQQLAADLQNTVPTGVSLAFPVNPGDGMLVATHPVQQTLGTGSLSFDSMLLIFWHDTTRKQLLRKKFSNGDPPW